MSVDPGKIGVGNGVEDMITLTNLTEQLLLENLAVRYRKKLVYTNCGTILVAINPFKDWTFTLKK